MKLVILAGGRGTRLSEETTIRPKPLIEIVYASNLAYNENLLKIWSKRFYNLLYIRVI